MLLCRLSDKVPDAVGRWTLPGGGLRFGESPSDACRREVHEETGLSIEVGSLVTVDSQLFMFERERAHVLRILYRCQVTGGELRDERNGTTDTCAWFTQEEMRAMDLVPVARLGVSHAFRRKS